MRNGCFVQVEHGHTAFREPSCRTTPEPSSCSDHTCTNSTSSSDPGNAFIKSALNYVIMFLSLLASRSHSLFPAADGSMANVMPSPEVFTGDHMRWQKLKLKVMLGILPWGIELHHPRAILQSGVEISFIQESDGPPGRI